MKFVRIFLLILILIGLGLLFTQKVWVPRFVDFILKNKTQQEQPIDNGVTKIILPQGGETFTAGQTYTLKWSSGPNSLDIFLIDKSLLKYGASVSLADRVYRIVNNGVYDYTFPKNLKDGIYQFRIGNVISNNFKVASNQQPDLTLVDGRQCYTYSRQATTDAPYKVSEFMDITINGNVVTGTKTGTQSGPDMTNGYSGTINGTLDQNSITAIYSYTVEGSKNKEKEIYRTDKTGIEKLRYPLIEEKGILVPDTTKSFTALHYSRVGCTGSN